MTAPTVTLEQHLAEVRLEGCTCPHAWKSLGVLYEINMGKGWVRLYDVKDGPVHSKGAATRTAPAPGRRGAPG